MEAIPLPFDSALFGYPVGRLDLLSSSATPSLSDLRRLSGPFHLSYIFSPVSLADVGLPHVDLRQTYVAQAPFIASGTMEWTTSFYDGSDDDALIRLGFESGRFSRFAIDPLFVNDEYVKLYRLWIERTLNHEIAEHILVAEVDDQIHGMLSAAKLSAGDLRIGLVAVDHDQRGKGLGKALLCGVHRLATSLEAKTITVVTQGANTAACELYIKFGFRLMHQVYVHHLWAHGPSC
jgi:dTDP-4-amino-4,6-dideoxy-D-galactose acyltransferase